MADLATLFITPIAYRTVAESALKALGTGIVSLSIRIAKDPDLLTPQTSQTHCGMSHGGLSGQHVAAYNKAKQAGILQDTNIETGDPIPWGQTVEDVTYPSEEDVLAMFAVSDFWFKNSNSSALQFADQNMHPDGYWIIPDDFEL